MKNLILALQILLKYGNPTHPTMCDHDVLIISPEISPDDVSKDDINTLKKLGFNITSEYGEECFASYKYGSC